MIIEFLPEAEDELGKATNYYNEIRWDLGFEFADEVKNTLKRIAQYPEAWHVISKRSRETKIRDRQGTCQNQPMTDGFWGTRKIRENTG